jgi:GH35 family endo-1,4-beta-xylanase
MRLACRIVLLALLAVAPSAAVCGDPSSDGVVEPPVGGGWEACTSRSRDKTLQLGLHMDLTWEDDGSKRRAAVARAREVHAAVSRNSFLWHLIEPTQGRYSWEITDAVVDELESNGIEPLFMSSLCTYVRGIL